MTELLLDEKSNFAFASKAINATFIDKGVFDYMHNMDLPFDSRMDAIAALILIKSVSASILQLHPLAAHCSRKLWSAITFDMTKKTAMRKLKAMEKLDALSYRGDMNAYIKEAEEIHAELNALEIPVQDDQRLLKLIKNLPDTFSSFKQSFFARTDWTWESLTSTMKDVQDIAPTNNHLGYALAARAYHNAPLHHQRAPRGPSRPCHYCKGDHFDRDCKQNRNARGSALPARPCKFCLGGHFDRDCKEMVCPNCKEKGHFADQCSKINKANSLYSWIVDCGASYSMTPCKEAILDLKLQREDPIEVGNGHYLIIEGRGHTIINNVRISDVCYVPDLKFNLLSAIALMEQGCTVIMKDITCQIIKYGRIILEAEKQDGIGGLLHINPTVEECNQPPILCLIGKAKDSLENWHRRLGHLNIQSILKLSKNALASGIEITNLDHSDCSSCMQSKAHKLAQETEADRVITFVGEVVSGDILEITPISADGQRYVSILIDHFSTWMSIRTLKSKDSKSVLKHFQDFAAFLKNQVKASVKTFRSDNGGEYTSIQFENFLLENGIIHETTAPYSPAQNGRSERFNRTLVEGIRACLTESNLPSGLWNYAASHVCYIMNRTRTSSLSNMTPFETLFGSKPDLSVIQEFGKPCWFFKDITTEKLENPGVEGWCLGIKQRSESYYVLSSSGKIVLTRNVRFGTHDSQLPVVSSSGPFSASYGCPPTEAQLHQDSDTDTTASDIESGPFSSSESSDTELSQRSGPEEFSSTEDDDIATLSEGDTNSIPETLDLESGPEIDTESESDETAPDHLGPQRHSTRSTRYQGGFALIASMIPEDSDSPTVPQAMKCPDWSDYEKAMEEEMCSLESNDTWEIVDRPTGANIIKSKMVLKRKRDSNGSIQRYKARLCAKGFLQIKGVDYEETFAPVCDLTTVKILLAVALHKGLHLGQMDIDAAYLNAPVHHELFMEPPPHLRNNFEGKVFRLKKAIYGLKQAGREWYLLLSKTLVDLGWHASDIDPCLFIRGSGEEIEYLSVYVDDIIVVARSKERVQAIKNEIASKFSAKDLGELSYILGVKVHRTSENTLELSQRAYINQIEERFKVGREHFSAVPLYEYPKIQPGESAELDEQRKTRYREILGSLQYLARWTRPDIANAVNILGRFQETPLEHHLELGMKLIGYLVLTKDLTLRFDGSQTLSLDGYSDADWGGDRIDYKSTTGFIVKLGGCPVSWNSHKQSCTASSTMQSELIALSDLTSEMMTVKHILNDLGLKVKATMRCDNQSAISAVQNDGYSSKAKHICIRKMFVKEFWNSGECAPIYVPSKENQADVFTKPLRRPSFEKSRATLLGSIPTKRGSIGFSAGICLNP